MEIVRESIFISALRSFCKAFFALCGLGLALALLLIVYSFFSGNPEEKTNLAILPDASGSREMVSLTAPAILQLNVHGVIGEPQNIDSDSVENILLDSRSGLLKHDRVKGILVHFNTPGGTVLDADNIYRMLKEYKEKYKVPIFSYVDGLCASGGMYIACATDQIYAGPTSIIGSVGVILGPFFNISDTLGKVGVQARTITEGLDKDMMSPFRPWKENEDASFKSVTSYFYNRFVQIVTDARPRLDKRKLIQEYGAQVFDGVKAQELGYVDTAMSSRNEALLALLNAAGINPKKEYQVVELTPSKGLLSQLVKGQNALFNGKVEHRLDIGQPKIRDQVAYLYTHE
ncbi:MAG: S49 family peptidase [Chlamydiia bacterium]|nr:S49 family peptidase [Chlamydiia bacterium]